MCVHRVNLTAVTTAMKTHRITKMEKSKRRPVHKDDAHSKERYFLVAESSLIITFHFKC